MRYLLLLIFPLHLLLALTLTDDQARYSHFELSHMYDISNKLTIDEMPMQTFETGPSQFSYGYLDGTRWFKLTLHNESQNSAFVLTFSEPLWHQFDLFTLKNGLWTASQAGLLIPLNKRQVHDTSPAFLLDIPKGETQTIYIKGQTVSGQLGAFEVFTKKKYFEPSRLDLADLYLFILMFLLIIAFFNLYLFTARQDRLYALYILYIVSVIIWFSVKSGLYLSWDIYGWDHGLHVTGAITVMFLTLFSREFLELKQRLYTTYKIFNGFALIFFILAILIAIDLPYASLTFNLISSVFFTLLLVISIKVYREGHLEMRYYLIALFIYMPTMGMLTLSFNGLIPNTDITRYAFLLGSFVEVIFFNSLMISHYHIVFKDKIRIQDELIKVKKEKEEVLESEIHSRVQELQETNKRLVLQTQELERVKENLSHAVTTDPLSDLYNRRYIIGVSGRLFDTALRYKQELSVIMIDLDDFKHINDTYGHAVGDDVIVNCAKILKESTRTSDILARYGGEEFLIFVPNTPYEEVLELTNRIQKNVAEARIPYSTEEPFSYTMSIGISHLQDNDLNMDQLIRRADKAMYMAKSKGKNRVESL